MYCRTLSNNTYNAAGMCTGPPESPPSWQSIVLRHVLNMCVNRITDDYLNAADSPKAISAVVKNVNIHISWKEYAVATTSIAASKTCIVRVQSQP